MRRDSKHQVAARQDAKETENLHQGNTNVSHSCLNLNAENAQWFFNFSQPATSSKSAIPAANPGAVAKRRLGRALGGMDQRQCADLGRWYARGRREPRGQRGGDECSPTQRRSVRDGFSHHHSLFGCHHCAAPNAMCVGDALRRGGMKQSQHPRDRYSPQREEQYRHEYPSGPSPACADCAGTPHHRRNLPAGLTVRCPRK